MENIGALAILLAFCFAIYAVIGSLAGKWGEPSVPGAERGARGLLHLGAADRRPRGS